MNQMKIIIFDFDGVILDSENSHFIAFNEGLKNLNINISEDEYYSKYISLDDRGVITNVVNDKNISVTNEEIDMIIKNKNDYFESRLIDNSKLFPGVEELIIQLSKNFVLSIGSGANRSEIIKTLKKVKKIKPKIQLGFNRRYDPGHFSLKKDLDKKTKKILSKFRYQKNTVFLHSDSSMMPKNRKTWSSWNYLSNKNEKSSTTYWMNQLQDLNTSLNVFVSLNPFKLPNKSLIHKKIVYEHPIFNNSTNEAQNNIAKIEELQKILFQ